jgi:hypothetical protein
MTLRRVHSEEYGGFATRVTQLVANGGFMAPMAMPRGASYRAVLMPPVWRDSSQTCSDEETGDSTDSGTLTTRHRERYVVSVIGFARVRLSGLSPSLFRCARSGVSGASFGSRSASGIERAPAPSIPRGRRLG